MIPEKCTAARNNCVIPQCICISRTTLRAVGDEGESRPQFRFSCTRSHTAPKQNVQSDSHYNRPTLKKIQVFSGEAEVTAAQASPSSRALLGEPRRSFHVPAAQRWQEDSPAGIYINISQVVCRRSMGSCKQAQSMPTHGYQ